MTHPDFEHAMAFWGHKIVDTIQKRSVATGTHFCITEFTHQTVFNLTAELFSHCLHTIANTQNRHTCLEHSHWCTWRITLGHTTWTARENDAGSAIFTNEFITHIVRMNFGEYTRITNTTSDQLRDLRTKVKDKNFRMHSSNYQVRLPGHSLYNSIVSRTPRR